MNTLDLCGKWLGECIFPNAGKIHFSATVPGSSIHDLIGAGHLPRDIFFRDNADSVTDFERCDYVYKRDFDFFGEYERAVLRFERIDTYADVFLNGTKVYHSENGNIRHDIDVSDSLRQGKNTLEVRLYSPIERVKDLPQRSGAFTKERMNTRRMQCTYGWDWVARFVCCGLGECTLLIPEEGEILPENVYVATIDADAESATVRVDISLQKKYGGTVLDFSILSPNGELASSASKYCKEDFIRLDFDIPAPSLWYPLGYGEQPLYTLIIKSGSRILYNESFGIRTVKIMQLPDTPGSKNYDLALSLKNKEYDFNESFSGFVLKINGEKVFCKGANWVPCVPFAGESIDARKTEILELCASAGVNMLRIWGGGAFESKHFYDECSRLGIMVTQDFLMACGTYPEDEDWFIEQLRKEADYAVRLCRNQPCLVWWSGDNENAVNGCDTDENYSGRRSAYEGIAPILYREDPYRRFLPSSPFGGRLYASNTVGTTHNTQFLGQFFEYLEQESLYNYKEEFKKYRARFIAEEPQLGAVSLPSLRRFMTDADIFDGDAMWLYHTKNNPALKHELFDYLLMMTEKVLGAFTDPHDRLFKLQYMQYEWIRVVMEQAKRERDFCSGIIFWMMNDCWPAAAGWALIDFYGLPKNAFYSFKRLASPLSASIDCENEGYRVFVMNDGDGKDVTVRIKILSEDGKCVKELKALRAHVGKHSSSVVFEAKGLLKDDEVIICDVESTDGCDRAFYKKGNLEISPASVIFDIDEEKQKITIRAKEKYVHAVTLSANAVFEDNCFSLLPHETRTVSYRKAKDFDPKAMRIEAYTLSGMQ